VCLRKSIHLTIYQKHTEDKLEKSVPSVHYGTLVQFYLKFRLKTFPVLKTLSSVEKRLKPLRMINNTPTKLSFFPLKPVSALDRPGRRYVREGNNSSPDPRGVDREAPRSESRLGRNKCHRLSENYLKEEPGAWQKSVSFRWRIRRS